MENGALPLIKHAYSFLVSNKFCHLLIIFANCLDPDQEQQNVGPDLDPISLTLL